MNILTNKISGRTGLHAGFTLVEMIVSLAIFSVVAVIALGALMKIVDANIKAQSLQSAITNLNFALDTMSREVRTGSTYDCLDSSFTTLGSSALTATACSVNLGRGIAFYSTKTDETSTCAKSKRLIIAYYFAASGGSYVLNRAQQRLCTDTIGTDAPFSPVLSIEVTLSDFRMFVSNSTPYPLAFIRLSGSAGAREKDKTYFDIQTSISPRIP